jgi:hypothetical protein
VDGILQLSSSRGVILTTAGVLMVLLFFGIPLVDKFRSILGSAIQPRVDVHNTDHEAHGDIRKALALLTQTVQSLQSQIDRNEGNRRESLEAVQRQLQMAITLLERE